MEQFDLLLHGGVIATWPGKSGEEAAQDYANKHAGVIVIAWRNHTETNYVDPHPNLEGIHP